MAYDTSPADPIPESISPKKAIEPDRPISQPPSTFESYMQGTPGQARGMPPAEAQAAQGTTPIEMTKTTGQTGTPTADTLLKQTNSVQDTMGTVGNRLNTPNLKLHRSQSHLLKNKLQDATSYVRAAGAKLGVEGPPMQTQSGMSPIARFLAYLGDGQDQLMNVQQKLKQMSASGQSMSASDMMYLQIKMGQAQQEVEYSSTLLGKVIQSMTQLFQTQL